MTSSLDTRLLLVASGLLLAAVAPGVACGSGETSSNATSSSSSSSGDVTTSATGGAGGATTTSSTTSSMGGSGGGTTTTSSSTTSSSTTSSSSTSSSTSSSSSTGDTWPACHDCLQMHCAAEIAACDAGCIAIQACLDTVCGNLAVIGSPEEGSCQVYCQTQHFGSKNEHLDLVNCANMASQCMPPCAFAGYDWNQCVDYETEGTCAPLLDACTNDMNCTDYLGCTLTCTTFQGCKDCFATPEGAAGRALFEAYWQCVEASCLAEFWLPHF